MEKGVHLQVYGSGTGLIRGFNRAKRRTTVDAVGRNARRCSFFEHLQPARWVVTQARDRQTLAVPATAAHRANRLHLHGSLLAAQHSAERRAEARAGHLDRPMVLFLGRRRHVGGAKRRR